MNKRLSIISLIASICFILIAVLSYLEIGFLSRFVSVLDFLTILLYIYIIVTFIYSILAWIKFRGKDNLRYMIYSIVSLFIVTGFVLFILWQYASTMSNFD